MQGIIAYCLTPRSRFRFARGGRWPRRGFSLLELVIVVAVSTLLMTIAIPGYQKYVLRAKDAAAIADIGQIQLAINRYAAANNGAPPPDLATINMAAKLDPWDNAYFYLNFAGAKGKGGFRKDKNLVPINTDYDLYSAGPDGQTVGPLTAKVSQDDVVRANDGSFIGVAADY
jgi:general secretion pathway protein G